MYLCKIICVKLDFKISDLDNMLLGSSYNTKIYILLVLVSDGVEQTRNKITRLNRLLLTLQCLQRVISVCSMGNIFLEGLQLCLANSSEKQQTLLARATKRLQVVPMAVSFRQRPDLLQSPTQITDCVSARLLLHKTRGCSCFQEHISN